MCAPMVTRHTSIRYPSSSAVIGRPHDFSLHRHPVSVNCSYQSRMVLSVGGPFAYRARNARCTVTTDLLCDIPTHKTTSPPGAAIFSLHTLASPSGRNVNYDDKQLTGKKIELCPSICTGFVNTFPPVFFPKINFCNPGLHYRTPCI